MPLTSYAKPFDISSPARGEGRSIVKKSLHPLSEIPEAFGLSMEGQGFVRGLGKALHREERRLLKSARDGVQALPPSYFENLKPGFQTPLPRYKIYNVTLSRVSDSFGKASAKYVVESNISTMARFYFHREPSLFPESPRQGVHTLRDIALPHVEEKILEMKEASIAKLSGSFGNKAAIDAPILSLEQANRDLKIVEDYKRRCDKWARAEKLMRISTPIRFGSALLTSWQIVSVLRQDWRAGNIDESRKVVGDIAGSHLLASLGSRVGNRFHGPKFAIPLAIVMGGLGSVYGQQLLGNSNTQ